MEKALARFPKDSSLQTQGCRAVTNLFNGVQNTNEVRFSRHFFCFNRDNASKSCCMFPFQMFLLVLCVSCWCVCIFCPVSRSGAREDHLCEKYLQAFMGRALREYLSRGRANSQTAHKINFISKLVVWGAPEICHGASTLTCAVIVHVKLRKKFSNFDFCGRDVFEMEFPFYSFVARAAFQPFVRARLANDSHACGRRVLDGCV